MTWNPSRCFWKTVHCVWGTFFFSFKTCRPPWGLQVLNPLTQCARGSFSCVDQPGRDVDLSPRSNSEVKNEWSYTATPLYTFMAWTGTSLPLSLYRVQLKCDGTRWRTGGEVKGKLASGVGSQYPSHYLGTWCIQHYYRWCAHLVCQ
jgi:hypothetical protein